MYVGLCSLQKLYFLNHCLVVFLVYFITYCCCTHTFLHVLSGNRVLLYATFEKLWTNLSGLSDNIRVSNLLLVFCKYNGRDKWFYNLFLPSLLIEFSTPLVDSLLISSRQLLSFHSVLAMCNQEINKRRLCAQVDAALG